MKKRKKITSLQLSTLIIIALVGVQEDAQANAIAQSESIQQTFQDDLVKYPLKTPDTSSPRATLQSFINNMNQSYHLLMAAHEMSINSTGLATPNTAKTVAHHAEKYFERAAHCVNLSKITASIRKGWSYEVTLALKEILDRIELPPFDSIPDAAAIELEEEAEEQPELYQWKIPNTNITIARVQEGPRQGEFLFAAETVARIEEYYHKVRHLPYKTDGTISKGFLKFYIRSPGLLLPPKWSQWLPDWAYKIYYSQTVWQWIAIPFLIAIALIFIFALLRIFRPWHNELPFLRRKRRQLLFIVLVYAIALTLYYVLDFYVNLTSHVLIVLSTTTDVISWFLLSWGILIAGTVIAESIVASPRIDPEGIQASYVRALFGVMGFLAAAGVFIYGLSRVGVTLLPLLTGVGIGGLAFALAARPTLENIIGSFMIFADTPYQVGQRVKVMGHDGTVESIGLRSTRIRLLSGHVTSIPNEKMASMDVENIGRRKFIKREFNVKVTYDTPPDKIKLATDILRDILSVPENPSDETEGEASDKNQQTEAPHPNEAINKPDFPPRISFNELNADSLNILVMYWFHPADYWAYLEHAQWINLQIMQRFNEAGIEFAFPTQTLYVAGDEKHPVPVVKKRN